MKSINDISFYEPVKLYHHLKYFFMYFDEIKNEYEENKHLIDWRPMHWDIGYVGEQGHLPPEKEIGWNVAPVLGTAFTKDRSILYGPNSKLLPNLTKLCEMTKVTTRVGILSVDPGSTLDWHKDDDNPSWKKHMILRILWGLDVPVEEGKEAFIEVESTQGIEKKIFKNNEMAIFSSHSKHRVVNNLSQKRIVLGFDIIASLKHLNEVINT
jgi:hypothetical protein